MKKRTLAAITLLFFIPSFSSPTLEQQTFVQGQSLVLSVQVLDELGNPVEGVLVHFCDETDGITIGEDYSNMEGFASVLWDTSNASIGEHKIHIWNEEDPSIFVERSDTYVYVVILSQAKLVLSVSSPNTVKPGEEFEVKVSVSNIGGAEALFVEAYVKGNRKSLGNITGGSTSKAFFKIRAEEIPGNYTLKVEVRAKEKETGRILLVSEEVSYRVKRTGIGLSIYAPSSVKEGSTFNYSVLVRNLGEDILSFELTVKLKGAFPSLIKKSGSVGANGLSRFEFSALTKSRDEVIITAEVRSGDLRDVATKTIKVIRRSSPQETAPQPSDQSEDKSEPDEAKNNSETSIGQIKGENRSFSRSETPSIEGGGEENLSIEAIEEGSSRRSSIISPLMLGICVLVLFSFVRRLWEVDRP